MLATEIHTFVFTLTVSDAITNKYKKGVIKLRYYKIPADFSYFKRSNSTTIFYEE